MKKAASAAGWVLLGIFLFLPLGKALCAGLGYRLEPANGAVLAVLAALLSAGAVVLSLVSNEGQALGISRVWYALLPPLTLVNGVFLLDGGALAWMGVIVCVGCCGYLAIRFGRPLTLQALALVLAGFLAFPIGLFGFFSLVLGDFGVKTVVSRIPSPDAAYYAEVVNSDQGALGGDTQVYVRWNKGYEGLLFRVYKTPRLVYCGEWGEAADMDIFWEGSGCLVINGTQYHIR